MNRQTFDPIHLPGLAYRHAFDWLAVQLQAAGGPVAALVPRIFHGVELLRRLHHLPFLDPLPEGFPQAIAALGLPVPIEMHPCSGPLRAIAWPEPAVRDVALLEPLQAALHPGGYLYVLAPGRLGRFLSEHRLSQKGRLLSARRALGLLRSHGLRVHQSLGLHGCRAVTHHYAGQVALRLGRLDWWERCHFAMRRDFVERGLAAHRLSALSLIVAEKPT